MKFKSHKIFISTLLILVTLTATALSQNAYAKSYVFQWTNVKEIEVTAYKLNIRSGPSTSYPVIGWLNQGDIVTVIGHLGSWFVIHNEDDMIGLISSTYTRVYSYHNTETTTDEPVETTTETEESDVSLAKDPSASLSEDELEMLTLVNKEREAAGLPTYEVDESLMNVARLKAKDLVDNQYFSHDSPTYGSPFDMLNQFNIPYSYAGENIAGNSTVSKAHTALMYSPGHKANILNDNFTKIGIGILDDDRYGKVFVQIFTKP